MRDESSIIDQVQQAQLDVQELKSTQFVGKSQIVVKEYVSDEITVTSTGPDLFVEAHAWCDVTAPSISEPNVLIAYCMVEARSGSTLVDNKHDGWQCNITNIENTHSNQASYQANIYRSSTGGSNVPVTTYSVRFHVWSAANITLTVGGGYHG